MVFPFLACWHECGGGFRLAGQAGKDKAHERAMQWAQKLARPARREGGVGKDHILTTKRHDRGRAIHASTVIPCRDPTSGIRHPLDLVIERRHSRQESANETVRPDPPVWSLVSRFGRVLALPRPKPEALDE
jgi:hypothetical protein